MLKVNNKDNRTTAMEIIFSQDGSFLKLWLESLLLSPKFMSDGKFYYVFLWIPIFLWMQNLGQNSGFIFMIIHWQRLNQFIFWKERIYVLYKKCVMKFSSGIKFSYLLCFWYKKSFLLHLNDNVLSYSSAVLWNSKKK